MSRLAAPPPPRRPSLPVFPGGRRPPGHTLVSSRSLRGLHRLLLLSLLGQVVIIGLLVGAACGACRQQSLSGRAVAALLRGEG